MEDPTLSVVATGAAVVAVLALVLAVGAQLRLARIRRDFRTLAGDGSTDIARVAAGQNQRIDRLDADVTRLRAQVSAAEDDVRQSLRNVAVVRYDAFGDMGGRLSFSAAIVDDFGDGIVVSSIHARSESRTYAKGIVGGRSSVTLSPEEQQALAAATKGEPRSLTHSRRKDVS
ncbi:DUF4446 family protein [Intrasporangium sp.]|uniref:DUF4446 family protein n=1 Tax=Intrasporangium sp. TaxID=1925024 RepID=UPI00293A7099|nr:DUF4446 family protein [Intrasporangium sp.]MDV3221045.1 DUF4446 family protein [Intrasporangium sp.]